MFEQILDKKTRHTLALLSKQAFIANFYLTGGTACALYLGQRKSFDLDFFSQKDFIDLYFICQGYYSLKQILRFFEKKYKGYNYNLMHILKSLIYFEDAEKDGQLVMLKKVKWEEVKKFLREEVKNL